MNKDEQKPVVQPVQLKEVDISDLKGMQEETQLSYAEDYEENEM